MSRIIRAGESYAYSDLIPRTLIGLNNQDIDGSLLHCTAMLPHLLTAYSLWRNWEIENNSSYDSNRLEQDERLQGVYLISLLQTIYSFGMKSTRANELMEMGVDNERLLFDEYGQSMESFDDALLDLSAMSPDQFWAEILPASTSEDVGMMYLVWQSVLNHKRWRNFYLDTYHISGVGIPFAMEFEKPQSTFPQVIGMGEIVLEKRFDRYLLPTFVRNTRYRNSFYALFAHRYEKESDMSIKSGVFRGLYNLMPGEDIAVLDAGCGTGLGYVNKPPRNIRIVGIDSSPEMVAIAQSRGELAGIGNLEDCSEVSKNDFDFVMMSFVDYWIAESDKPAVFKSLKQTLKKKGKVVFNVHKPQPGWQEIYSKLLKDECGYSSVSFSQEVIERTGGGMYTAYYVVAEV